MIVVAENAVERFTEASKFAAQHNLLRPWLDKLKYLDGYANGEGQRKDTRCTLYPDSSPFSFGFTMEVKDDPREDWRHWFVGGLIYHGPVPDDATNADNPTLTVELSSEEGAHWGVHT